LKELSEETKMETKKRTDAPERNRDPITNAPGSHPIGTGVGAAAGGAAGIGAAVAAGAVLGTAAGPVGTVVGAAVGAVVGGLVGKGVAEQINPTVEEAYWRDNYATRPYVAPGTSHDDYGPAYQLGWESRGRYRGKKFDEVEKDLGSDWERAKGKSRLSWDQARKASRDAWDRIDRGNG
jgi:hypothetical protein